MNLNTLDLNLFVVFDTIFHERNLTRASEVLNVTQPAVSNALARLRATFGDPLFVRAGQVMMPTPAAQNLAGPVRQALRQLQTGLDQFGHFDPLNSEKVFNISIGEAAAAVMLPDLIRSVHELAPLVKINTYQVDRHEIVLELASGSLDFAIDIPQLAKSELNAAKILQDRYVCVLRKNHPLARRRLTMGRYLALDHVTVSSRRRGRSLVDIALQRLGRQAKTVLRVSHVEAALHTVMETDMVAAVSLSTARLYDVAIRELPFDTPPLEQILYWHKNADLDPANVWLRERISAVGVQTRLLGLKPPQGLRSLHSAATSTPVESRRSGNHARGNRKNR